MVNFISLFFRRFGIGATYITLSALIGEHQPFTMYPMYSSFPDHADYYLMQDTKGNDVYWFQNFRHSGDEVKDMFLVRQTRVNEYENMEMNKKFAKEVTDYLLRSATKDLICDSLRLFRIDLKRDGDQIVKDSVLLYETSVH